MNKDLYDHMIHLSRSLETNSGKTLVRKMIPGGYDALPLNNNAADIATLLYTYWEDIIRNLEGVKIIASLAAFCDPGVLAAHVQHAANQAAQEHTDKIRRLQEKIERRNKMRQSELENGKRIIDYLLIRHDEV